MDQLELNRERRRQRALERLGSNNPRCVICGYDDPLALELHHIAGRAFGDEKVPVCRNCHRPLSDWQKDHTPQLSHPPSESEWLLHMVEGLADLLELVVKRLREFKVKLLAFQRPPSTKGEA
jgi:hypothetical protein